VPLNPQLSPLIQLQDLDLRRAELKEQQRQIPDLLQSAERPLREAQRQLQDTSAAAERAGKTRRDHERELEAQEGQIEKLKARTADIKKNVEYQAHLFEIQVANKKKGEIEEQILVLMEEAERAQVAVKEQTAQLHDAEGKFSQKKAELEALGSKVATELGTLDEKHAEVARAIEKALMDRYNKLKATRKDLAVAPVKDGTCSGCRLQLAPQLVAEVKRSNELLTCSFCHRILYWKGESEQKSEATTEPADTAAEGLAEPV
jgi:predicted  nucleic acid-binding Zn-ribbon protein